MVEEKKEKNKKIKEAEKFYQKGLICGQESDADGAIKSTAAILTRGNGSFSYPSKFFLDIEFDHDYKIDSILN